MPQVGRCQQVFLPVKNRKDNVDLDHLQFCTFVLCRGTKNRSLYVKFWEQEALCKGEIVVFVCLSCACRSCQFIDFDRMIYLPRICRCYQRSRPTLNTIRFCWDQRQKTSLKWLHLPAEVKTQPPLHHQSKELIKKSHQNLSKVKFTLIINAFVSCIRSIARPWKNVHQSYQFKHSRKPDNPQLPWATYHTQVTLRHFAIWYSRCWRTLWR